MSKVMSAVGARAMAADLDADRFSGPDEYEIAATLRAYADMLDRQTVDREAVREKVDVLVCEAASTGWNDKDFGFHEGVIERVTDAILALMPVGGVARELEWKQSNISDWEADTPFGSYLVHYDHSAEHWWWIANCNDDGGEGIYHLEAAKAAAQAHYNDAVAKAVKPGPDVSGLVGALEKIAALETEYPNATVRNMATVARKALSAFKGGE